MSEFIKYGKFDTLEKARNGLRHVPDREKLARARVDLYNIHQKAKRILSDEKREDRETRG
jgi:hypothetical protein